MCVNFVHSTNAANHYATPPTSCTEGREEKAGMEKVSRLPQPLHSYFDHWWRQSKKVIYSMLEGA